MSSAVALELQVLDGDKVIAKQTFDQTKVIIGRILSADFKVADSRVSRIHALLERLDDGSLRLTDLASTHGTFVNGERVVERMIGPNDEIKLAALRLKLTFVPVPAEVQPPPHSPYPTGVGVRRGSASQVGVAVGGASAPVGASASGGASSSVSGGASTQNSSAAAGSGNLSASPSKNPSVAVPQARAGSSRAGSSSEIQINPSGHAVAVSRDPTAIRSLKETARTRGVLDPAGMTDELELTVYWQETILNIDHYRKGEAKISIGTNEKNTYIVGSSAIPERFEFVKVKGQSAEVILHASMKGSIRTQGKMQTVEDLLRSGRSTVLLGGQDIAKIQVGNVNFFMMFVPEPPPLPKAKIFDQGALYWGTQLSAGSFAILLLLLAQVLRQPIEGQVKEIPENLRKIIIEEFKKKKEAPPPPVVEKKIPGKTNTEAKPNPVAVTKSQEKKQGGNEGEGMRERGAEGKRGRPDAKHETGIQNRPKTSSSTKVKDAPIQAKNDGILSALKNTGLGTKLAKVSGVEGGATGNDPLDKAFAGVGGGGIQNGRGAGGSGLQGTGPGGGGTAVGVGGLGSKGFGGGASGTGVGSIPGKGDFAVGTEAVGVTVVGSLSREEIKRVIDSHASEIRFCYSRELQRDPGLFGKVKIKWKIVTGGEVQAATVLENSTGSVALANCIKDKLNNWKFPTPAAGAEGNVEWPWIFKPSGS